MKSLTSRSGRTVNRDTIMPLQNRLWRCCGLAVVGDRTGYRTGGLRAHQQLPEHGGLVIQEDGETGDRIRENCTALGALCCDTQLRAPTPGDQLGMLADRHVTVFSNLVHIRPDLWKLFSIPGVSLATSYYSDDPGQHEAITGRRGSYAKTRGNIAEAIKRGIPCISRRVYLLW
jgi:hypothetical protein